MELHNTPTADPHFVGLIAERLLKHIKSPKFTHAEQREQLDLLGALNQHHLKGRNGDPELDAQIRAMETAYRMQIEATDAFDISKESAGTRAMYGDTKFQRSCLLARRLAERGVRFTTVYYTEDSSNQPWDSHQDHYARHAKLCADADKAAGALIADLHRRGQLDETLVILGGEFGRTPFAEIKKDKTRPGRDHHSTGFSMLLSGGGVRGGTVYGSTDELGMNAEKDPVHVHDLHATILYLMGIDHEKLTYHYSGRDFRLTDVSGNVVQDIVG